MLNMCRLTLAAAAVASIIQPEFVCREVAEEMPINLQGRDPVHRVSITPLVCVFPVVEAPPTPISHPDLVVVPQASPIQPECA